MKILKPKDESVNLKFVFYYMQTVKITFDTHKRYWISVFSKLPISLPPLPEQRAIVSKIEELLSDLDNGKQQLLTAQQQLKVYRQSLLKAAFEGKLTAGWRESHKQGNSNSLALAAEPEENYGENGKLPEGWKILNLKSICHIVGGVTKGKDYKGRQTISLPYLRVANVQDGYLDLKEIKKIEVLPSDLDKYRLISGDILYTEGGDKDKLGRGTIWKNEIPDCIHQNHIFRARPFSKNINPRYIAYYSQTKSAKSYFFKHGKQTTNLASINLTILSGLPLPICSTEEQQLLIDELESKLTIYDKMEETISQSLLQAETLRQSILKRAFEGRLV
jgi:type I restriction enzyme S subunit